MPAFLLLAAALALFALTGCATYSQGLERGELWAESGNFEEAEKAYAKALECEPNRPEAHSRLAALKVRWAQRELDAALDAEARGDLSTAMPYFRRAHALSTEVKADEALAQALGSRLSVADAHLRGGRIEEAASIYESVLQAAPEDSRARTGSNKAAEALSAELMKSGADYERRGLFGNALVSYTRAEALHVQAKEAKQRSDEMRHRLVEELTFTVEARFAVAGPAPVFGPVAQPLRNPASNPAFTLEALSRFFNDVPLTQVVNQAPDDARGVRLVLTSDAVTFERTKTLEERSSKFVAGNGLAANPKWTELDGKVKSIEKELETAESELGGFIASYAKVQAKLEASRTLVERCWAAALNSCSEALDECYDGVTRGAGSQRCRTSSLCTKDACKVLSDTMEKRHEEYDAARKVLSQKYENTVAIRERAKKVRDARAQELPSTQQPTYAEFPYEVERHALTAKLRITRRSEPLFMGQASSTSAFSFVANRATTESEEFVVTSEDTTHRAFPRYKIEADALSLESEAALADRVAQTAVRAVAQRIRSDLEQWRGRYRDEARKALAQNQPSTSAVESAVRAVLLFPDERPEDWTKALARVCKLKDPHRLAQP